MSCELMLIVGYLLFFVTDKAEVNTSTRNVVHRNVVGYISVRFVPEVLRVSQGNTVTGHVHVVVQSHHTHGRPFQPPLRACVVDQSVATASWFTADIHRRRDLAACSILHPMYVSESTERPEVAAIYSVMVHGVLVGRSAVRFYVIKTHTSSNVDADRYNQTAYNELSINDDLVVTPEDHVISQNHGTTAQVKPVSDADQSTASDVSRLVCRLSVNVTDCLNMVDVKTGASYGVSVTQRWWIADDYHIVVVSSVQRTTADVLCYLLLTLIAVNLVGLGGQLDYDEAIQQLRRPSALAVGLFCRFAVMPTVSFTHQYLAFDVSVFVYVVLSNVIVL